MHPFVFIPSDIIIPHTERIGVFDAYPNPIAIDGIVSYIASWWLE